MTIVEDSLYATAPHITLLKSLDYSYIIGVKPKRHAWLFDYVSASACEKIRLTREGKRYGGCCTLMNEVA